MMNDRGVEQTRHISITSATADGVVSRTEVHITTRQCCSGDGSAQCGCGGAMQDAQEYTQYEQEGECFDPSTCCDAREQALIAALRAYLRPDVAPECLMAKLKATLDHCCGDEQ
ncbi:hypothetical protein BISA_1479 [Bifidobacterium saguini DSM 23967]|uniref:Uncharacterized protein n=2 Tax=Bifidobacterium saguini TaxID=762210 RepID=A0A087DCZ2_9BIFI|nr:hypothetical protein [Bifidobacterium saguini]KFI93392.1 hypothetical protein BISA_1479 [Bifidobacterium saguini DSM 23967]